MVKRISLLLLAIASVGCQPKVSADVDKAIVGVWLQDDEVFRRGVSLDGERTSYEEYFANSEYHSLVRTKSSRGEEFEITKGRWQVAEGKVSLTFLQSWKIDTKGAARRTTVLHEGAMLELYRLDEGRLEYKHPTQGLLKFARGTHPEGLNRDVLNVK